MYKDFYVERMVCVEDDINWLVIEVGYGFKETGGGREGRLRNS